MKKQALKITEIPLIFIVNSGFPLTQTMFYRHGEIVAITNTVSFFIKISKYRSKKSQIPNTEKPYDPNLLILGDFNSELKDSCLNAFSNVNNLKSLNKEPTCFKNPNNLSCIDLFLTNRSKYFQNMFTIETGISDFHKLVVTVLKMFYKEQKPKII